jgi:putative membrane protein insertion efficiency factor
MDKDHAQANFGFRRVQMRGVEVELHLDPSLAVSAMRAFLGTTPLDAEIDALPIPSHPHWLRIVVTLLRLYRTKRSRAIGSRCVFEPSCSRYSELAFRRLGFSKGLFATVQRLLRCRPGAGGIDLPA